MEKQFVDRRKNNVGRRVQVLIGSGLDSGKKGTIITSFDWRKQQGAYRAPDINDIPVKLDNGQLIYMHKNRLFYID